MRQRRIGRHAGKPVEQRALARTLIADQADFHGIAPFAGLSRRQQLLECMFYRLGLAVVQGRAAETDAIEGVGHHARKGRQPGLAGHRGQACPGGGGELALRLRRRANQPPPGQETLEPAIELDFHPAAAGPPGAIPGPAGRQSPSQPPEQPDRAPAALPPRRSPQVPAAPSGPRD